jgi:hypothetical protein
MQYISAERLSQIRKLPPGHLCSVPEMGRYMSVYRTRTSFCSWISYRCLSMYIIGYPFIFSIFSGSASLFRFFKKYTALLNVHFEPCLCYNAHCEEITTATFGDSKPFCGQTRHACLLHRNGSAWGQSIMIRRYGRADQIAHHNTLQVSALWTGQDAYHQTSCTLMSNHHLQV